MLKQPLHAHITIMARYDVDPDGDVQATLSEPSGPFAPSAQVEEQQLPDTGGDSGRPATEDGNDTENVSSTENGKYKFQQNN